MTQEKKKWMPKRNDAGGRPPLEVKAQGSYIFRDLLKHIRAKELDLEPGVKTLCRFRVLFAHVNLEQTIGRLVPPGELKLDTEAVLMQYKGIDR